MLFRGNETKEKTAREQNVLAKAIGNLVKVIDDPGDKGTRRREKHLV
jgi:hypothetical protein